MARRAASLIAVAAYLAMLPSVAYAASNAPPLDVNNPWSLPLVGLPISPPNSSRAGGGANISFTNTTGTVALPQAWPIVLNTSVTASATMNGTATAGFPAFADARSAYNTPNVSLVVNATEDQVVTLGPNVQLDVYNRTSNTTIGMVNTVPFGINLGSEGQWNGSVYFNGLYDGNRVAGGKWVPVPSTMNASTMFNGSMSQNVSVYLTQGILDETIYTGIIDFMAPDVVVPPPYGCDADISIVFAASINAPPLTIPGNLLSPHGRCNQGNGTIVLGRPLFQALYAYFDTQGVMYLAQANYNDTVPLGLPFVANETLQPPEIPPPAPKKSLASREQASSYIGGILAACLMLLIALVSG